MDNRILAFRLQKFMGFEDTGWLELRRINLLFGQNSSGKSAIIRALLLLKQSVDAPQSFGPLILSAPDGVDMGTYSDWVYQHNADLDVSFGFKLNMQGNPLQRDEPETFQWGYEIGVISPWLELELTFGVLSGDKKTVCLKKILLKGESKIGDIVKEVVIFSAQLNQITEKWLYETEITLNKDNSTSTLVGEEWEPIKPVFQKGFVPVLRPADFIDESVFFDYIKAKTSNENAFSEFFILNRVLVDCRDYINRAFASIVYLAPIRQEPQRFFYVPQLAEGNVGKHGEHLVRAYLSAQKQNQARIDKVNDWLKHLGLNCQLEVLPLNQEGSLYGIYLTELGGEKEADSLRVNLRDVGFGLSQSLPIILASLLAEPGSLIIIEQPELHLHPRAQSSLADMFVDAIYRVVQQKDEEGNIETIRNHNDVFLILETHSEDLLLRLRRRIAESTIGKHLDSMAPNLHLEPKDVGMYFIHRLLEKQQSSITLIPLNEFGDLLEKPEGFAGFFSNDLQELKAITSAKLEAPEE